MTHRDARDIGNEDVFTRRPREVTAIKRLIGSDGRYTSTPRGREFLQLFKKKQKKTNETPITDKRTTKKTTTKPVYVRHPDNRPRLYTVYRGLTVETCIRGTRNGTFGTRPSRDVTGRRGGPLYHIYIYIYLLVCSILIMSPGACSTS